MLCHTRLAAGPLLRANARSQCGAHATLATGKERVELRHVDRLGLRAGGADARIPEVDPADFTRGVDHEVPERHVTVGDEYQGPTVACF